MNNQNKSSAEENRVCLFRTKQSRCKTSVRKNLPLVICELHLRHYFGLEVGYVKFDGKSNIGFVGGFLKPVIGKTIKRGTIIVPTKLYFDRIVRPQEVDSTLTPEDIPTMLDGFVINPQIMHTIKEYGRRWPLSFEHRQIIEMYRNFIGTEVVDPGPEQLDHYPGLIAQIESTKTGSITHIRNQPISRIFQHDHVYAQDNNSDLTSISNLNISLSFQYFLNHCLYSEMKLLHNKDYYLHHLNFNCKFIPRIGLVATQDIPDPLFLVIDGQTAGTSIYYHMHVSEQDKIIQEDKYDLKYFDAEMTFNEAFKGGFCPSG